MNPKSSPNGFWGLSKLILAGGATSVNLNYFCSDGVQINNLVIPYGVQTITGETYKEKGYTDDCVKTLPSTLN